MTTATIPAAGTVSRSWKTGLIITRADLTGISSGDPAAIMDGPGERCQVLPPGSVPGLDLLEEQFLTSMNTLAAAEDAPEITACQMEIQVWRDGYDQPAFSSQARYAGWTVLAASPAPEHSESGCLAFADTRARRARPPLATSIPPHPSTRRPRRCPRGAHLLRRPPRTRPAHHRRRRRLGQLARDGRTPSIPSWPPLIRNPS